VLWQGSSSDSSGYSNPDGAPESLSAFLIFATAIAVLCLTELFTSGSVLWISRPAIPVSSRLSFQAMVTRNLWSGFADRPLAALREGWRAWCICLRRPAFCIGSRLGVACGTALCIVELLAMLVIGLVKLRDPETGLPSRPMTAMLLLIPVLQRSSLLPWDGSAFGCAFNRTPRT